MAKSPAALIIDDAGNPVAVSYNGSVYRLETVAVLTADDGTPIPTEGPRKALSVHDPQLKDILVQVLRELRTVNAYFAEIVEDTIEVDDEG